MRRLLVVLLVVLFSTVTFAGNPTHLGKKPPSFGFGEFANAVHPEKDLSGFAGEVVVLEFLRTSCPGCTGVMPALEKTHGKYARPDVHVICVTNDSVELTQRFLIHESLGRKITYPIVTKCNQRFGVTALPWTYVIGRDGKVAWAGHPGKGYGKELAAAVAAADPAMPKAPAKLRKALAYVAAEKYEKALGIAAKALDAEETKLFGKYVEDRVRKFFDREMATVDLLVKKGDVYQACERLDAMDAKWKGTPYAEQIGRRRGALTEDEEKKAACEAWKRYHAVEAMARAGKKSALPAARVKLEALKRGEVQSAAKAADDLLKILGKPWTLSDAANFGACGK